MVRPTGRYGLNGETNSLSSQTIKILNDIENGLILVPSWFNNSIEWVQTGHTTEQEFITSYNYLISQGIAHSPTVTPTPEPIPEPIPEPTPQAQPTSFYWIQKPSQQPSGRAEAYNITESTKQKWLSNGYIISTTEPVYQSGTVLWQDVTWFGKGICTNKRGERYTMVIPCATPEPVIEPPVIEPPIIETPEPIPEIDTSITDNMIIQRLDSFSIINGRAVGQITFTATDSFNPYYYDKNITNIIQFKTPNGVNILPFVKQNTLRFTATERTETIQYDEGMNDNTRANVESFVWSDVTLPVPFSKSLKFEIVTAPTNGEPIPIPKVQTAGIMGAGFTGAIGILILLGFIADSRRKK